MLLLMKLAYRSPIATEKNFYLAETAFSARQLQFYIKTECVALHSSLLYSMATI